MQDILIVGAGPVGLAAALELARHGVTCRIIEKRTAPSKLSRAVGIMPETIAKFGPAGDAIKAEGMDINRTTIKRTGKTLMHLDNTDRSLFPDVMTGLPQNRTEEIMRDALILLGVTVEYGLALTTIGTTPNNAAVTFSDKTAASYDWVIGADGIQSTVRKQLGIAYPGFDLPEQWSIADVDISRDFDDSNVTVHIQGPGGLFVMVLPIERHRARIVASSDDALASLPEKLNIEKIHRTGTFSISVRQAETYLMGRALLAGDAAHCHSPVGGKGMNLGIHDAIAAVEAILNGTTDNYTQAQHSVGAKVMNASERGRKFITSGTQLSKLTATVLTKSATHIPAVSRAFYRNLTAL